MNKWGDTHMQILYFLIAILATSIGATAGIGGGVIIKPILDFLGGFNLETINMLSSFTVFSMAIVSIIKQIKYKFKLEVRKTVFIGIGSIIGGILGDAILTRIINVINNDAKVIMYQNIILAILLIAVFIYMNNKKSMKQFKIEKSMLCIFIGIALGTISSFLSIGGGPVNVCVLTLFFSMGTKEAAVNSIITILFSQMPKIFTSIDNVFLGYYDLTMLPVMVIGGVLGGIIGAKLNRNMSNEFIVKVLNMVILSLVLLNIYNVSGVFR